MYVLLQLSQDNKTVIKKLSAFCVCPNGSRKECTHVSAAIFTMREYAYSFNLVPGQSSKILSPTDKPRMWGVPKGNASREDLAQDAEYFFPTAGEIWEEKKKRTAQGSADGEAQQGQTKKKRVSSIQKWYEEVDRLKIGEGVSREQVDAQLKKIQDTARKTQLAKREKKEKRKEKKKAKKAGSTQQQS